MHQIIDKCYKYEFEMYFLYNDFNRAFDTANRVIHRLHEIGIPSKLVRIFKMKIQHTRDSATVREPKNRFDFQLGYIKEIPCIHFI
jgi:hypothetical protein